MSATPIAAQIRNAVHASAARERMRPCIRACAAATLSASGNGLVPAENIAAQRFRGDKDVPLVLRGAVTPDALAGSQFAQYAVSDFLLNLGPMSAGSQLLKLGMNLSFDPGIAVIPVPAMSRARSMSYSSAKARRSQCAHCRSAT